MIARRDPSPPRSGAARPAGRLRLLVVAAAATAPARRLLAARAVPHQPERDGAAPAVLPVLRGEPVAGHRVPARTSDLLLASRYPAHARRRPVIEGPPQARRQQAQLAAPNPWLPEKPDRAL